MIYCPNKTERYIAAFRLLYQKLIINNGIKKKYCISLRKICNFEALINSTVQPIDLEKFCSEILTAVFLIKRFDFFINSDKTYLLNKKAFTGLLLNICNLTDYLEILEINKKVVLKSSIKINKTIMPLIKRLGGYTLKEKNNLYMIFNFPITNKKSEDFETAYYLLQNPLSAVNLYLIDQ